MGATILDGSLDGTGTEMAILELAISAVEEWAEEVTVFPLREMDVHHCLGCFGCWIKTPGVCVIDDDARRINRAIVNSDLVAYFTPVTFGGYSSQLKKAIDRTIGIIGPDFMLIDGEVHHSRRYDHYARILAIGQLDQANAESERIFRTLLGRNAINMHAPAQISTVVYSDTAEEDIRTQITRALDELGVEK